MRRRSRSKARSKRNIGGTPVSKNVTLAAHETARVDLPAMSTSSDRNPKLWWPYGSARRISTARASSSRPDGAVSDRQDVQFGIREVTSELDAQKHRLFKINGEEHPDPRRRLDAGHAAALRRRARGRTKSATPAT